MHSDSGMELPERNRRVRPDESVGIRTKVSGSRAGSWGPVFQGGQVLGPAFLTLRFQHWVSLRWRSFAASAGAGIVTTVVGRFAVGMGQQVAAIPWALPMPVLSPRPHDLPAILLIAGACAVSIAAVGCFDFCRREVQ